MFEPNALLQGRYRIVRILGSGGMGTVYEATDERFGNRVALKQALLLDSGLASAFEREARLLRTLRHAALPGVIDYFAEERWWFLVMDARGAGAWPCRPFVQGLSARVRCPR